MRRVIIVGVLLAALLVLARPADAGGGCHRAGETSGTGTTVELSMMCMNPTILRTDAHEVTFVNRDDMTHNVWGARWGRDELKPGASFTQTFTEGTHLFACTLHPGMLGAVIVGDPDAKLAAAPLAATRDAGSGGSWVTPGLVGALLGLVGATGLRYALAPLLRRR